MTFKRFSYITLNGHQYPSPSLDVTLLGTNGVEKQTQALIDTGADWSSIPRRWGIELGADLSLLHTAEMRAGKGPAIQREEWWNRSPADATRDDLAVVVMGHEVPIAPFLRTTHEPLEEFAVLGRQDFLNFFLFACQQRKREFTLEVA